MLWPESEVIAAKLSGSLQLVQRIDSVLAENVGAIVSLDFLKLFTRSRERELIQILKQYEELGVVEALRIVTCPDHTDVLKELDAQVLQLYCDQCEKEVDATSWIESVAYRVIPRNFPKTMSFETSSGIPRFQVAFSFPGDYRELVRKIAGELAQQYGKARVLYDEFHTAEFARPNLDTHLQELYFNQSQLVVVFLCAAYNKSQWCGLEWRAIRTMIKQHRDDQIMLVRLDDGEVKGIFEIDGYVDAHGKSAKQIADFVCERVGLGNSPTPSSSTSFTAEVGKISGRLFIAYVLDKSLNNRSVQTRLLAQRERVDLSAFQQYLEQSNRWILKCERLFGGAAILSFHWACCLTAHAILQFLDQTNACEQLILECCLLLSKSLNVECLVDSKNIVPFTACCKSNPIDALRLIGLHHEDLTES